MTTALLTVAEVARRLRCHPHTVRRWIWDRRLRAVKVGDMVRIPEEELERFLVPVPGEPADERTNPPRGAAALLAVMRGLRRSVARADVEAMERGIQEAEQPAEGSNPLA